MYTFKHFRQSVTNDKRDGVRGEQAGAASAVDGLTALEDEPFLELQYLVEGESSKMELVVVKSLYNA